MHKNMKLVCGVVAILMLARSASSERKRYDGYEVLAVTPSTREQLQILRDISHKVDFWQEPQRLNAKIHFMVSPQHLHLVTGLLKAAKLTVSVHRENVQDRLDEEWARLDERFKDPEEYAFNIDDYNRYNDIMTWLDQKKQECRSGFTCTTEDIGQSFEGRALRVFKLTKSGSGRRVVWSDSMIHAREWLAGATNLKILNHVLTSNDIAVTNLLNQYDFYFLPVMNPDGYEYTFTDERFWRKSRNTNEGSSCMGTDLNRNYNQSWMTDGTDDDPCSDLYGGPAAGSEPETQTVQNFILANGGNNMIAFISVHTNAQMWLHPYGHTEDGFECAISPDNDNQTDVANAAADATQNTFGTTWTRGSFCETLYAMSGSTVDYAYGKGRIKYAYTPELRGPGFDPGPDAITPSFQETWNGYVALINRAAALS